VTPHTIPALISGGFAMTVAVIAWQRRSRVGATGLSVAMTGHVLWILGQGVSISSVPLSWTLFWFNVSFLGVATSAHGWFSFGVEYTGRGDWLTAGRVRLLLSITAVLLVLFVTNPQDLVYVDPSIDQGTFRYDWGPIAWVGFGFWFLLGTAGNGFFLTKLVHSKNYYRRAALFYILVSTPCFVGVLLSLTEVSPFPHLTLWGYTYLGLGAVSVLVATHSQVLHLLPIDRLFTLLGTRYEDVVPVARNVVVEELKSGVIVLDSENRIVDINPRARAMLGTARKRIVGRTLQDVVDRDAFETDDLEFLDSNVRSGRYDARWVQTETGERRCYDIVITSLADKREDASGRIALINDVTRQQRRKQELEDRTESLERQNQRLDDFAGIVSHDLRNPLNTAEGYLDMAEETGDPEHFEQVRHSHERMRTIVDDVLTLAKQGQAVSGPETVAIDDVALTAWDTVETSEATIEIEVQGTVEADGDRLLQIFENLFRNAIDHGPADVTVRIGTLDRGFFVADDGPGIPEDEREDVLEQGYTTSEDGTGFGLAIVQTIADAHGWHVEVTESQFGGARFEVRTGDHSPAST
jgi:PAS domain S-box-containing protein